MASNQKMDAHKKFNVPVMNGCKRVVGAIQPGYIPWLGIFEQIWNSDTYLLYDDLQYTRHSWQNRNLIKGPSGQQWLTVPIRQQFGQKINKTRIDNSLNWRRKHWKTILGCYGRAAYFNKYKGFFQYVYNRNWDYLGDLNVCIIKNIVSELCINTRLVITSEMGLENDFKYPAAPQKKRNERIVHFMRHLGGNVLYNGALGQCYLDKEYLASKGIQVIFQKYKHPMYTQRFGTFIPYLSIIDLLFNHGPHSLDVLLTTRIKDGYLC